MEIKKEFISYDRKHRMSVIHIKNENFCYFTLEEYDIENKKTFCYTFKEVIEYLKENNIIRIKQKLTNDIIHHFKKSEIININENESMVISNIKTFAIEMYIALYLINPEFIYDIDD